MFDAARRSVFRDLVFFRSFRIPRTDRLPIVLRFSKQTSITNTNPIFWSRSVEPIVLVKRFELGNPEEIMSSGTMRGLNLSLSCPKEMLSHVPRNEVSGPFYDAHQISELTWPHRPLKESWNAVSRESGLRSAWSQRWSSWAGGVSRGGSGWNPSAFRLSWCPVRNATPLMRLYVTDGENKGSDLWLWFSLFINQL